MNSRQPSKDGERLALYVRRSRLKHSLPALLSLFNIGKLSAAVVAVFVVLLFWMSGLAYIGNLVRIAAAGLSFILVPFLLVALLRGLRLGLFGVVEFIAGLSYLPVKLMGDLDLQRRNLHLLALIYSAQGRFKNALKYFLADETSHNVFFGKLTSPWTERRRLPELLLRLGRKEEAWAFAQYNVQGDRRDGRDIDCPRVRENLQSDLIVAACVLAESGQTDQACQYLEEAVALAAPNEMMTQSHTTTNLKSPSELQALYALGLLESWRGHYDLAIDALEQCGTAIFDIRKAAVRLPGAHNGELLGFSQNLLGQCYLLTGRLDRLDKIIDVSTKENRLEPPSSADKLTVYLLEADYKMALGQGSEAILLLEKTIVALSTSDAHYDRLMLEALQKYQKALVMTGRDDDAKDIAHLIEHLTSLETEEKETTIPLIAPSTRGRQPDLAATKQTSNQSVLAFIALFGYTVINLVFNGAAFAATPWIALTALALVVCLRHVFEQVRLRKANFFAAQAIDKIQATEVVLKPEGQLLPGIIFKTCRIVEGPADLVGRLLEMDVSNNLIYASQACSAAPKSMIRARLYQSDGGGKILAIETLGRVLTVKERKPRLNHEYALKQAAKDL